MNGTGPREERGYRRSIPRGRKNMKKGKEEGEKQPGIYQE